MSLENVKTAKIKEVPTLLLAQVKPEELNISNADEFTESVKLSLRLVGVNF